MAVGSPAGGRESNREAPGTGGNFPVINHPALLDHERFLVKSDRGANMPGDTQEEVAHLKIDRPL